ncbi:MAG: polysaccharide biosynthesis tyrosine autokinase, partial [Planctomycetota bacterium]|nr:polysaccharide biosynthesis tyrosine autokinase [Planctomycetota bacterium]
ADASRVLVRQDAQVPEIPAFPKWYLVIPVVAFLCVSGTAGLIVLRELLEQRVRGPADVASIPRTRVLGVVPDISEDPSRPERIETVVRDAPTGVTAECYRHIRSEIMKRLEGRGNQVLLVAGGMPGSGGTSTIINLAWSFANAQRNVLIIDGNLRRPAVHKALELPERPGLGEFVLGKESFDAAVQDTSHPNLHVLTAGIADGMVFDRLTTGAVDELISAAREKYDVVFIDVPPMIVASDAMMLAANRCDGVILVVRAYSEKRGLVSRIRNQMNDVKAEFLGVVINSVRGAAGGYFRRNFRATHEYHNQPAEESQTKDKGRRRKRAAAESPNGELPHDDAPHRVIDEDPQQSAQAAPDATDDPKSN